MAGKLLEAEEAEALGEVEAELEAARRFVRFGRATVRYAAAAPRSAPARTVARSAAVAAARRHAPALLRSRPTGPAPGYRRGGKRWSSQRRRRRPAPWQWDPGAWPGSWPGVVRVGVPVAPTYAPWGDDPGTAEPDWGDDADAGVEPGGPDGDDPGRFEFP
jgi:hypothetical protein